MAKNESYVVRIGAAEGLAASADSGGSVERRGRRHRAAVAREGPAAARGGAGLRRASRRRSPAACSSTSAPPRAVRRIQALHPIGVEGLCNAALAGSAEARRMLARSTDDVAAEVRKLVMSCVADGPEPAKNGAAIAAKLVKDPERRDPRRCRARARALRRQGQGHRASARRSSSCSTIADRDVRLIADPRDRRARDRRAEERRRDDGQAVRARRRGREARAAARREAGRRRGPHRHRGRGRLAARARRGGRCRARLGDARGRDARRRARRSGSAGAQGRARAARRAEGQARARGARSHARARGPRSQPRAQPARADHDRAGRAQGGRDRAPHAGRSPRAPSASVARPPPRRSGSSIATRR